MEREQKNSDDRSEELSDDVNALLDQIDEVQEEKAAEFVHTYVQKGGQGDSFILTAQFLAETAALSVWQGMTYDLFKKVVSRINKAIHSAGELTREPSEDELKKGWEDANNVIDRERELNHSYEEAAAFKAIIFANELQHKLGTVHLGSVRYYRLALAAEAEGLDSSQLARRIIDEWLRH